MNILFCPNLHVSKIGTFVYCLEKTTIGIFWIGKRILFFFLFCFYKIIHQPYLFGLEREIYFLQIIHQIYLWIGEGNFFKFHLHLWTTHTFRLFFGPSCYFFESFFLKLGSALSLLLLIFVLCAVPSPSSHNFNWSYLQTNLFLQLYLGSTAIGKP